MSSYYWWLVHRSLNVQFLSFSMSIVCNRSTKWWKVNNHKPVRLTSSISSFFNSPQNTKWWKNPRGICVIKLAVCFRALLLVASHFSHRISRVLYLFSMYSDGWIVVSIFRAVQILPETNFWFAWKGLNFIQTVLRECSPHVCRGKMHLDTCLLHQMYDSVRLIQAVCLIGQKKSPNVPCRFAAMLRIEYRRARTDLDRLQDAPRFWIQYTK